MSNVKEMLNGIGEVLEATNKIVDSMQDGDRKQLSVLTDEVSKMTGKDAKEIANFINHFVHNTTVAYVTRGKNGGLIKGSKVAKVVKPGKTDTTEESSNS